MSDNFEVEAGKELSFAEKLGMHPGLAIGYLGLLLFMVGDGVEAGFLSPLLVDLHFSTEKVALVFSAYGATAALASWLSGALTDIFGPKKVMWAGLLIWLGLEMPFLLGGIAHANYTTILVCYGVRGLGYPLFAYGFLCWVAAGSEEHTSELQALRHLVCPLLLEKRTRRNHSTGHAHVGRRARARRDRSRPR